MTNGITPEIRCFSCFIVSRSSRPINRQDSRDHRSPSVHHPECKCRRRTGPAAGGRVWPARRAARQQAGAVQKTDGEAGLSTRRAATSASLSRQGGQTSG